MEDLPEFTSAEVIGYLVTLYAVVPAIIITVMYSFLSTTESDLGKLSGKIEQCNFPVGAKKEKEVVETAKANTNKFVIISAKIFHYSMAYYLIMLFVSLLSKCCAKKDEEVAWFLGIGAIVYFVYFILYLIFDVWNAFWSLFNASQCGKIRIGVWLVFIIGIYGFGPMLVLCFAKSLPYKEVSLHLSWITLTIFQLLFWWLVLPFLYKPLTNLSKVRKAVSKYHKP